MQFSSPDKLLFTDPPVTKGEVAKYYAAVATRMLPYVRGRTLSLVVCPQGVKSECFYKKNPAPITINDEEELLLAVQNNAIEFHVTSLPDIMVFDLDPDEGLGLREVRQGVRDLKSVLDSLNLVSFLKTSGGKGYHVVVPFVPIADWAAFSNFAKTVAQYMEQKWPTRYTSNVRKINRRGKIFVDWIRNGRGATSIAPYSLRARSGARVSLPIAWSDLPKIAPNSITMKKALTSIKAANPWEGFFKVQLTQKLA